MTKGKSGMPQRGAEAHVARAFLSSVICPLRTTITAAFQPLRAYASFDKPHPASWTFRHFEDNMDSMRHLSTSLPRTHRRNDAPELLADFKAAALSVTNLYKTAAASQTKAREAGYQDALEDLLAFLDHENLGLMDGEGWRVRQWATERWVDDARLADGQQRHGSDEETEEEAHGQQHARAESRSSSPEMQRKAPCGQHISSEADEPMPETRRTAASEPPQMQTQPPATDVFTFRSNQAYPTNHDREGGMELDAVSMPSSTTESTPANVRLVPRQPGRSKNHSRRGNNTAPTTTLNFNLGAGAGSKRKMPYAEFFDVSGSNFDRSQDGKDGGSGGRSGKRGRHV